MSLYKEAFANAEPDLLSLLLAAKSCVHLGHRKLALRYYDQAIAMAPSHATAFSRKACLVLSEKFGAATPAPISSQRKQISMRALGNKGRFGNQIFQYGFLKIYAAKFNLDVGTMEWPGTYLFDIKDPRPNTPLERVRQSKFDMIAALNDSEPSLSDKEVTGYFQFDTHLWSTHKGVFQEVFRESNQLSNFLQPALSNICPPNATLVAIHLRRGDFTAAGIPTAPVQWYLDWLDQHWNNFDSPSLYIATDAPELLSVFSNYAPICCDDLDLDCAGFEFSVDWFILKHADIVCASNSTFSISATLANKKARQFYRPSFTNQRLYSFDPWNSDVLTKE